MLFVIHGVRVPPSPTATCQLWPVSRNAGQATYIEMWRGSGRLSVSVAAPFVWRCPNNLTVAPFPHPAHRTGRALLTHPALGQDLTPSHTPGYAAARAQPYEPILPVKVREWIAPAPASPELMLVA